MAKSALIGALRVSLGLDSAQFVTDLGKAQKRLAGFSKLAGTAFTAAAAAGVAAAAALGAAVVAAANHADELSKAAQKVGTTTEALSRLEWAAKLSDVSLEQLTGGLGRLSRSMLDVAMGSKGPAATAFSALGIAISDASGQMRDADAVFADIAEKFSRMEDGSTKTALAMAIFGRAGAEMIPLLNSGRKGLADMAAESDRLGLTISTETGKAAEEFNDSLTRLSAVTEGLANRLLVAVLPAMQSFADLLSDPEFQQGVQITIDLVGGLAKVLADAARWAVELGNVLPKAIASGEDRALYENVPGYAEFIAQHEIGKSGGDGIGMGAGSFDGMLATMGVSLPPVKPLTIDIESLGTAASKTAREAIDPLQARISELSDVLTITHDPITQMQMDLTDLDTIWKEGRISVEQYGQAVQRTMLTAASDTLGSLGQITGALSGAFKDNKAFAVANAVINTAQGITKALAEGGPFGFPIAAAIGVAGAAQIATILSAEPGSAGGVSVAAPVAPAAPAPTGPTTAFIDVHGDSFGRQHIEGLAEQLADLIRDGGGGDLRVVLSGH